ncbi:hypothetical protein [Kingella potus]|nr:hypothetical protein [Kingella potus]
MYIANGYCLIAVPSEKRVPFSDGLLRFTPQDTLRQTRLADTV